MCHLARPRGASDQQRARFPLGRRAGRRRRRGDHRAADAGLRALGRLGRADRPFASSRIAAAAPVETPQTVDIYAQGDDLVIRCELAGVAREYMEVAALPRAAVALRRARRRPRGRRRTDYVRERRYGPFRRTMQPAAPRRAEPAAGRPRAGSTRGRGRGRRVPGSGRANRDRGRRSRRGQHRRGRQRLSTTSGVAVEPAGAGSSPDPARR